MNRIDASLASAITASTRRRVKNHGPRRFVASTRSNSSSVRSRNRDDVAIPTLLTMRSTVPCSASTRSARAVAESAARSPWTAAQPSFRAALASASASRSTTTTFEPASDSALAIARPM